MKPPDQEEIWRPVPSEPALHASSWGRVFRVDPMPGRGKKPGPTYGKIQTDKRTGYQRAYINYQGIGWRIVAHLVCEAWHGPRPDGMVCQHIDDNSLNNRPENLRWGTQLENMRTESNREKSRKALVGRSEPTWIINQRQHGRRPWSKFSQREINGIESECRQSTTPGVEQ